MEAAEIIDVCREAIYVLILISAPLMIIATIIGLIISLFQALTQIQEATLTFVPKMLAMLVVLAMMLPFILDTLAEFTNRLQERIVHIE